MGRLMAMCTHGACYLTVVPEMNSGNMLITKA